MSKQYKDVIETKILKIHPVTEETRLRQIESTLAILVKKVNELQIRVIRLTDETKSTRDTVRRNASRKEV